MQKMNHISKNHKFGLFVHDFKECLTFNYEMFHERQMSWK